MQERATALKKSSSCRSDELYVSAFVTGTTYFIDQKNFWPIEKTRTQGLFMPF